MVSKTAARPAIFYKMTGRFRVSLDGENQNTLVAMSLWGEVFVLRAKAGRERVYPSRF
jgi:hypothetical protein